MADFAERLRAIYETEYRAYSRALREVVREAIEAEGGHQRASKSLELALQAVLEREGVPESVWSRLWGLAALQESGGQAPSLGREDLRRVFARFGKHRDEAPDEALVNAVEGSLAQVRLSRREAYALLVKNHEERREERRLRASVLERAELHVLPGVAGALAGRLVFPAKARPEAEEFYGMSVADMRKATSEPDLLFGTNELLHFLDMFRPERRWPLVALHDVAMVPSEGAVLEDLAAKDLKDLYTMRHRRGTLGTFVWKKSRWWLNGKVPLSEGWVGLERWLEKCRQALWAAEGEEEEAVGFGVTAERLAAERLPRGKGENSAKGPAAEQRAKEVFREVMGEEALRELERDGRLTFTARDGRTYSVGPTGEVRDEEDRVRVCVRGGERLPRHERVLARLLAVRDRPELLNGGHMAPWDVRSR